MTKQQPTTGNICMDMISAALAHWKAKGKKVTVINLDKMYWNLFRVYMRKQKPDLWFDDYGLQFNNVLIRKGHRFMHERLECEFEKKKILADA
jgi:hypothetical protein